MAFCILVIDTRKQFQLQTGVFSKRPDVVTFDVYIVQQLMKKLFSIVKKLSEERFAELHSDWPN